MAGIALLRGARTLLPDGRMQPADVLLESGRITSVGPAQAAPSNAEVVALDGLILAPGFIDVHVHGGGGFSLLGADAGEVARYANWAVSRGVTGFLATICASSLEQGIACVQATAAAKPNDEGARLLGVNLE